MLTFRHEYQKIVAPYFSFKDMRYAVDNDETLDEMFRLVFPNEGIVIYFRKEGVIFLYEGDSDMVATHPIFDIFWQICDKMKSISSFAGIAKHTLILHAVDIKESEDIAKFENNPRFKLYNPFGILDDFNIRYEFSKDADNDKVKFNFGRFYKEDIARHELMPFRTEFNKDLETGIGLMCRLEISRKDKHPTVSKFKQLYSDSKKMINDFNRIDNVE